MRLSRRLVFTLVALDFLILAVVIVWLWRRETSPATVAPAPPPRVAPSDAPADAAEGSPQAAQLHAAETNPREDLEILRDLLGQFTTALKGRNRPPLGDNQDITAALTGKNKQGIVFIPPNHPAIQREQLVDRWGNPYFFHARSAEDFDLRSAGPDGKMYTADDFQLP